jgi:hypothetical protein
MPENLKNHSAEGEPSTLSGIRAGPAEGETCNAGWRVWGLFYSWPVAPQQSRLRFKQPPNLSPFFPFVQDGINYISSSR